MARRICIVYPDGSMTVFAAESEGAALAAGRHELKIYNRGQRDQTKKAQLGEIEVDFVSFRERC